MQSQPQPIETLQLPFKFDPVALRQDLERISEARWIAHFNQRNYDGDWSGVALRGPEGASHPIQQLFATPGIDKWADTELLDQCPYLKQVMGSFKCPLLSVRLLRLGPGSVIKAHTDHSLSFEDGEVRLHVPIQTDDKIQFWLNERLIPMHAGETWYLNVNLSHRVENNSTLHRVHLVLDCKVNSWLAQQAGLTD